MAKVIYGQTVSDARGKVGGTVFSKNRYGAFTRRKVTPTNRNTVAQAAVRSNFAYLSKYWSGTLTADERSAWIAYATSYPRTDIFGQAIVLSGANMFISLNAVLLQAGAAIITSPPATNVVTPIPFDASSFTVQTDGTCEFAQTAAAAAGTLKWYCFATRPMPAGRTAQKSDFRFIGVKAAATAGFPAIIQYETEYLAKYGTPTVGANVGILISTVDTLTGLITVGTNLSTLVIDAP